MELHKSDVNVESFVDSVVSIFHTPARGKDITIKMELCDESKASSEGILKSDKISIDKFKISQVLRNLMSNALKFTPDGGTITVRACFVPVETIETKEIIKNGHDNLKGSYKNDITLLPVLRLKPMESQKSATSNDAVIVGDLEDGRLSNRHDGNVRTVQKGVLHISVIDSGAGISPENQKRLFKEIIQFNPEVLQGILLTHHPLDLPNTTQSSSIMPPSFFVCS